MVVAAGILFLVMVFGFLIYIVISVVDTIDTDSEREEIIKDFFRYFRKIDPRSEDTDVTETPAAEEEAAETTETPEATPTEAAK